MSSIASLSRLRHNPAFNNSVRWGLGLGILAFLLVSFDVRQTASALRQTAWLLAFPAILGLTAMQVLVASVWKFLSARLSQLRFGWAFAIKAQYASLVAGSITPSSIGADMFRIYALGSACPWQQALAPIIMQRVTSYTALLGLGIMASLLVPLPKGMGPAIGLAAGALIAVIAVLWIASRGARQSESWIGRMLRRIRVAPESFGARGPVFWQATGEGLALALLFHAASIACTYLLVLAVGGHPAVLPMLAVLALARLAVLIPIAINGIGFQEGAMALLFPVVGLPSEMGLAVSVLNRLSLLLTVLLGGVFLAMGNARLQNPLQAQAPTAATES